NPSTFQGEGHMIRVNRNKLPRAFAVLLCFTAAATVVLSGRARAQAGGAGAAASKDMDLAGYSDLQGRPAYQPVIHRQGQRWIAYIGLHAGAERNPLTG